MSEDKLTKDKLQTAEAVLGLGLIVVKSLHETGVAMVFINAEGQVEMCPATELAIDSLEQQEALHTLLDMGYEDERLLIYLKGRKARKELNVKNLRP